ncbi:MAG TPA: hypothetical protein VK616_13320, partial [Flavitalea sp.]|nr:hypothetical protein [Flavitalea sp.]
NNEHEIDLVLQAFADSIAEMVEAGFFKPTNHPAKNAQVTFRVENQPPVPGSRLGKDREGNPAWFISNPDQPGQFLQLNKK